MKGSVFNVVFKFVGVGIGFISSIVLARTYGADVLGIIATVTSLYTLGATIALQGTNTLMLRIVPEYRMSHGVAGVCAVYLKLATVTVLSSIVVGAMLFALMKTESLTVPLVSSMLPAVLVLLASTSLFNSATLRGMGDYKIFSLLELLPALLMFFVVVFCAFVGLHNQVFVHVYFLTTLLVCFSSFLAVRWVLTERPIAWSLVPSSRAFLKTSIPMLGVTLSTMAIQHMDILLIGKYMDHGKVGVYSIYNRIAMIVLFASASVNSMFSPKVAALFREKKYIELRQFVKKTTLLLTILVFFIAIMVIYFHELILDMYGSEYSEDLLALYILLAIPAVNACFGSTGFFLNMTGGQNVFFIIMLGAAVLNLVGNILLIPSYGLLGASVASLVAMLSWNVMATLVIKKRYGYTLFFFGVNREKA